MPVRGVFSRLWPWALLGLALAFNTVARYRLATMPLERDEGEYAYAGQLILQHIPPYVLAYNMKFPGTYLAYAAIMKLFGETTAGIHFGMLVLTSLSIVLMFVLARRVFGSVRAAAICAASFTLMTMDSHAFALAGHATHVVLLPALAGFCMLARPGRRSGWWRDLLIGSLFGLALLAKQPGAMFLVAGELWLLIDEFATPHPRSVRVWLGRSVLLAIGAALPVALTVLWLWHGHALEHGYFWTIFYAHAYGSEMGWRKGLTALPRVLAYVAHYSGWLWIIGIVGTAGALFITPGGLALKLIALLATSFVAVCAGFYFRPHYFILAMPSLALGVGVVQIAVDRVVRQRNIARLCWVAIWGLAAAVFLKAEWRTFLVTDPVQVSRQVYGIDVFAAAPQLARYVKGITSPLDTMLVLGSEPELYFYADRKSCTGYIYAYPLTENQPYASRMQHDMAAEIEASRPAVVVVVHNWQSWSVRAESDPWIINWWVDYQRAHYAPVTSMRTGAAAEIPVTIPWTDLDGGMDITVYQRRDSIKHGAVPRLSAGSSRWVWRLPPADT